jgi:hypothetical protein
MFGILTAGCGPLQMPTSQNSHNFWDHLVYIDLYRKIQDVMLGQYHNMFDYDTGVAI